MSRRRQKPGAQAVTTPPTAGITAQFQAQLYQGPLPHPDILLQFDAVLPGAAERIITMTEQQLQHRMALEKAAVGADIKRAYLGLLSATLMGLAGLGVAGWSAVTNHQSAAVGIGGVSLGGLVSVFIYGTHSQSTERERRARLMTGQQPPPKS